MTDETSQRYSYVDPDLTFINTNINNVEWVSIPLQVKGKHPGQGYVS